MFNRRKYWTTPPADILSAGAPLESHAPDPAQIAAILAEIGLPCAVVSAQNAPQVSTYHIVLDSLKDAHKAARSVKALSMALRAPAAYMPSDVAHFAIQTGKRERGTVTLRDALMASTAPRTPTRAALGIDSAGEAVTIDIASLPHMLIAGATGSGKSVALNTILCGLLYNAAPTQARFVMIDPKQVELSAYAGLPHLAAPIATDPAAAIALLERVNVAMDRRYRAMSRQRAKHIGQTDSPRMIVVIDELADLMLTSKRRAETAIVRIAQLGRAAGIHLIAATQKPLVSVVTGLIQGNIPAKLALQTAGTSDSVRILGHKGAETLLGRGDALLKLPDRVQETRLQCAYTSDAEIAAIVAHWQRGPQRQSRRN